MNSDARLLNWRFVVPPSHERLLLLSVDHDWMYRHPELFVGHLEALHLAALN